MLLRLKLDAKKGGKTFHKELLHQGIDETTAAQLTEIYLQPSNIKQYMGFLLLTIRYPHLSFTLKFKQG